VKNVSLSVAPSAALARAGQDYISVPSAEQRRSDARLLQRSPWQGSETEFELFNGHYLGIHNRLDPQQPERLLNLAYLSPQPAYYAGDLLRRLQLTAVAGGMLLLITALIQSDRFLPVLLATLCLMLLALMSARPGRWVFSTAIGAIAVCEISCGPFSGARAEQFVALLRERIEGAQVVLPSGSRRLAAELAEHRRMLESGSLSRRHYESARQRLLRRLHGDNGSEIQLA
jgi:hypothetical protein